MPYPKLKFRLSAKKDFETLCIFTKESGFDDGRNLDWAVFNSYPELKNYFAKKNNYRIKDKKSLQFFINKKYNDEKLTMEKQLKVSEERWEKIAPKYFLLTDELFNGRKWPKGKYIAYGTIWGLYPRFLGDKTFQFPFSHRKPNYISVVIAHELLHFMFYSYFYERYPKYSQSKDNFFVWNISEIFNTIVQNSPDWLKCFKIKSLGYPEHKSIVMEISNVLYIKNVWDLDEIVDEIIKKFQEKKVIPKKAGLD